MQLAVPPGQVLVRLVAILWRDEVCAVQHSEHSLHGTGADIPASHQIVYQLIIITT